MASAHDELHAHAGRVDRADDPVGATDTHLPLETPALLHGRPEVPRAAPDLDVVRVRPAPVPLDRRALGNGHGLRLEEVVADLHGSGGRTGGRGDEQREDECERQYAHQKTGVSLYVPKISWRASTISPSVACTRAHANRFGIRLWRSSAAAARSTPSACSTSAPSRRARTACTRPICLRSTAGSMRRISSSPSSPSR